MTKYLDILGTYFPDTQAEIPPGKDPANYSHIAWKSPQIPQAVLDQYISMVPVTTTESDATNNETISITVVNPFPYPIVRGQLVRISGIDALSSLPKILLCDCVSKETLNCIGMVTADIPANSIGEVLGLGVMSNIDTSAYAPGADLYAGPNGTISGTKTHVAFWQRIGYVYKSAVNGSVFINPSKVEDHSYRSTNLAFTDVSSPYVKRSSPQYSTVARFLFRGTYDVGAVSQVKIIAWGDDEVGTGYCRLFDITHGTVVGEVNTIHTSDVPVIVSFPSFNFPADEAIIEVQLKSNNGKPCYISSLSLYH